MEKEEVLETTDEVVEDVEVEVLDHEENQPVVEEKVEVVEEPKEETVLSPEGTTEMAAILDKKDGKKSKAPLFIALAIIVVAIIGFVVFALPMFSPSGKTVVEQEINMFFDALQKGIEKSEKRVLDFDLEKESLGVTGTFTVDSNYHDSSIDLRKLKDYKVNYQGVISKQDNEASMKLSLQKNNKDFMAIDGYVEGKEMFISLGDLYSKTITGTLPTEIKDIEMSKQQDLEDMKVLLEKTKQIAKANIQEKNITKEKVTKGKETLTKVQYKMNVPQFTKDLLEAYQEDKEIIKILSKMTQLSEKEITDGIKETIEDIDVESDHVLVMDIFLKGMVSEVEEMHITAEEYVLLISKDKDQYLYSVQYEGEQLFEGDYNPKEETFTLKKDDMLLVNVTSKNGNDKIYVSFSEGDTKLIVDVDIQNSVIKTTQENKVTALISYQASGENIKATFTNEMKIDKNQKVVSIPKNNTISYENMENDMENITLKVYEKLGEFIQDIMPGMMQGA